MKILDYKCKCGCDEFMFVPNDNRENVLGLHCVRCGKWLKWANKNEKILYKMFSRKGETNETNK